MYNNNSKALINSFQMDANAVENEEELNKLALTGFRRIHWLIEDRKYTVDLTADQTLIAIKKIVEIFYDAKIRRFL